MEEQLHQTSALDLFGGFEKYQYALNILVRDRLTNLPEESFGLLEFQFKKHASVRKTLREILEGEDITWNQEDLEILTTPPLIQFF